MRRAMDVGASAEQVTELERIVRAPTSPQRAVKRARVILYAAKGWENQRIARKVKMGVNGVATWRSRFVAEGVGGLLQDKRGRGRKRTYDDVAVEEIVKRTTTEKPYARTHWSRATMAKVAGVSESTVGRIWRVHGLKPHLSQTFKVSNDPRFAEKLHDIVGLYLSPPENAVVFSVDEKSQIQALDRTQPGLPLKKGRAGTMTHDYKRNGTTTLFAALNILTGAVLGLCMPRHTNKEWLKFLKRIVTEVPPDKAVHVICDNYATHKHPSVQRWLKRNPRVTVHFTPTSASWLNMVERFFRDLTENALRRGVFTSVPDLIDAIDVYLIKHNRAPKPFIWTASASDILAKVTRARDALLAQIKARDEALA